MVGLTFIQKKLVFYTEISTFSLIEFSKIVDFYRIIELPKANQTDIPDHQYYLGCNAKRLVRLTFLEKKFVFQSEKSTYSVFYFQKIVKFYGVKELFKVNQIDIPDYQSHLGCTAKRLVRLTFLEKKFVFQSEKSTYSLIIPYSIFKK